MAATGLRAGLLAEILTMAVDTLRTNKLRSFLTILGVVIGITSIVSVTALLRGFDESFKDLFRQIGPTTMFVTKFSFVSRSQGKSFRDLIKRLAERKIAVTLTDAARTRLVEEGYDPVYGARPLKRTIQRRLLDPLALKVLEGAFREGDTVEVGLHDDALTFTAVKPAGATAYATCA